MTEEDKEKPMIKGMFPSLCKEETIDGEECIIVPKKNYRLVLLVPYSGTFAQSGNGTRVPIAGVQDNDWSLHVDMFICGKLQPPMSKINLLLDRDSDTKLPRIEIGWNG